MSSAAAALSKSTPYFFPSPLFVGESGAYVDNEMRITSGQAQARIVKLIFALTFSAPRKPREAGKPPTPARTATCPVHIDRCASYLAIDPRAEPTDALRRLALMQITEACERKLIFRRQATRADFVESKMPAPQALRGWFVYWLPTDWAEVPSYAVKKPMAIAEALDAAEAEEEPAKPDRWRERIPLTPEPIPVGRGIPRPPKLPWLMPNEGLKLGRQEVPARLHIVHYRGWAVLDILEDPERPTKAKNRRRKGRQTERPFRLKAANYGTIVGTKELNDALHARSAPLEAAISSREIAANVERMRKLLNRLFRDRLGPVEETVAHQATVAKGNATDEDCILALRRGAKRIKTYGLVLEIIGDVGRAAAKAGGSNDTGRHQDRDETENSFQILVKSLRYLRDEPDGFQAAAARKAVSMADPQMLEKARARL